MIYFIICFILGAAVGFSFTPNDWRFYFFLFVPHIMAWTLKADL